MDLANLDPDLDLAYKARLAEIEAQRAANTEARRRYKIVRGYFRGGRRTIATGLTLAEAQAHCSDPETSSSTCRKAANRARTRRMGPWFDGYTEE